MTEEYKEVTDYKKILIVSGIIGGIIAVGLSLYSLDDFGMLIPDFSEKQEPTELEKQLSMIQEEYKKFIDLGISADDVLNFQEMPCETFNTPEMISTDPKYTAIIEQRRSDCF